MSEPNSTQGEQRLHTLRSSELRKPASRKSPAGVRRAPRGKSEIVTEDNASAHTGGLTPQQARAVELLVQGRTDGQVGAEVGVGRECVNRWRHHNPHFIAALNAERLALWQASRERLRALRDKALDVLDNALDAGDTHVAMGLLKLHATDRAPLGATDVRGAVIELAQRLQMDLLIKELGTDQSSAILRALSHRWLGSPSKTITGPADPSDLDE